MLTSIICTPAFLGECMEFLNVILSPPSFLLWGKVGCFPPNSNIYLYSVFFFSASFLPNHGNWSLIKQSTYTPGKRIMLWNTPLGRLSPSSYSHCSPPPPPPLLRFIFLLWTSWTAQAPPAFSVFFSPFFNYSGTQFCVLFMGGVCIKKIKETSFYLFKVNFFKEKKYSK